MLFFIASILMAAVMAGSSTKVASIKQPACPKGRGIVSWAKAVTLVIGSRLVSWAKAHNFRSKVLGNRVK